MTPPQKAYLTTIIGVALVFMIYWSVAQWWAFLVIPFGLWCAHRSRLMEQLRREEQHRNKRWWGK